MGRRRERGERGRGGNALGGRKERKEEENNNNPRGWGYRG